jgi:hypothetical protein
MVNPAARALQQELYGVKKRDTAYNFSSTKEMSYVTPM